MKGVLIMVDETLNIAYIQNIIAPIVKEYDIQKVYIVGNFVRGKIGYYDALEFLIEKGEFSFLPSLSKLQYSLEFTFKRKIILHTTTDFNKGKFRSFQNEKLLIYDASK